MRNGKPQPEGMISVRNLTNDNLKGISVMGRIAWKVFETGSDIEYVYLWRGDGWYCAVLHNGNESYEWLPNIVGTKERGDALC